jgi:hypothetical protein
LFGLHPKPVAAPTPDTTATQCAGASDDCRRYQGSSRTPYVPRGPGRGIGGGGYGGKGFTLGISLSSTRSRFDTTAALRHAPGRQTTNLNLAFSPTQNWTANWSTSYDMGIRQFTYHSLTFQRDLRRWRASFSFNKTAAGNFSFSFNITLTDQPDIKFDYDQNTYVR